MAKNHTDKEAKFGGTPASVTSVALISWHVLLWRGSSGIPTVQMKQQAARKLT